MQIETGITCATDAGWTMDYYGWSKWVSRPRITKGRDQSALHVSHPLKEFEHCRCWKRYPIIRPWCKLHVSYRASLPRLKFIRQNCFIYIMICLLDVYLEVSQMEHGDGIITFLLHSEVDYFKVTVLNDLFLAERPILTTFGPAPFQAASRHHYDYDLLLPDHPPKVGVCFR